MEKRWNRAGTYMVKDVNPDGDSQPFQFNASGNKVYLTASGTFIVTTGNRDNELWVTEELMRELSKTRSGCFQSLD